LNMPSVLWLDGALVSRDEARISIDDRGFLYGAACFETMRTFDGTVFRLEQHLDRLERGLQALNITPPTRERVHVAIAATLEANQLSDARVRLTVSAGIAGRRPSLQPSDTPTMLLTVDEISTTAAPVRAMVTRSVRVDVDRPLPFAKTTNYLLWLLALDEAQQFGFDQAVLLDSREEVIEAATANIFVVIEDVLVTPPPEVGPLPGITREAVLECADELDLEIQERRLRLVELKGAREVLLTNSVIGVQALAELSVGAEHWRYDAPGSVTKALLANYQKMVVRECGQHGNDEDGVARGISDE
jgi:branched-chain amino acid aminotransferase